MKNLRFIEYFPNKIVCSSEKKPEPPEPFDFRSNSLVKCLSFIFLWSFSFIFFLYLSFKIPDFNLLSFFDRQPIFFILWILTLVCGAGLICYLRMGFAVWYLSLIFTVLSLIYRFQNHPEFMIFLPLWILTVLYGALLMLSLLPPQDQSNLPSESLTIESDGITLVTNHPNSQTKVYKPEEIQFSFEGISGYNLLERRYYSNNDVKMTIILGTGIESQQISFDSATKDWANQVTKILGLPKPFPTYETYIVNDDDACHTTYLDLDRETRTLILSVGLSSLSGRFKIPLSIEKRFKRILSLDDIADIQSEICEGEYWDDVCYYYRLICCLKSGERLIFMEDVSPNDTIYVEGKRIKLNSAEYKVNVQKYVNTEVARIRNFLYI